METPSRLTRDLHLLRQPLLDWYTEHRRDLPWRRTADPYAIWISEIMLQQTRVAVVIERFLAFVESFPTAADLARADEQQVLALWSGLGYYRRARMLHQAAKVVVENHQGRMPAAYDELLLLPGIGSYTAAAIASIAYGLPHAVLDGNVERVLCRLTGRDLPEARDRARFRKQLEREANQLLDPAQPGEFNQAMMELGATVCTPRSPQCLACPLVAACPTRGEHKTPPKPKMQSRALGCALAVRKISGQKERKLLLLEQRAASETVMPGLWQLPALVDPHVPEQETALTVRHAIMQVNYQVRVRRVEAGELEALTIAAGERRWVPLGEAVGMALTGLARKILLRLGLFPSIAVPRGKGVL